MKMIGDKDSVMRRLASGGAWSMLSSLSYNGLLLLGSLLTARSIGAAAYGRFSFVQSTTGMFGIFAGLGLGLTATKYLAELKTSYPERAGRLVALTQAAGGMSAVFFGMAFAVLSRVSLRLGLFPELGAGLDTGAVLLVANTIFGLQMGVLCGFEAFQAMAGLNAVRGLSALIFMVGGAGFAGESGALSGLTIASAMGDIATWLWLRRVYRSVGIRVRYRGCWNERSVLWSFSLPAMLASSLSVAGPWAITAMLARRSNLYVEVGVFNAATQWRNILIFIPNVLGQVLTPIFASARPERASAAIKSLLWKASAANASCAVLVAFPLFIAGRKLLGLYGSEFSHRSTMMTFTLTSGLFQCIQGPAGNLIAASGKMWAGMWMYLGWSAILVASANVFLNISPSAESLGAALLAACMVHSIWAFLYSARLIKNWARGAPRGFQTERAGETSTGRIEEIRPEVFQTP